MQFQIKCSSEDQHKLEVILDILCDALSDNGYYYEGYPNLTESEYWMTVGSFE